MSDENQMTKEERANQELIRLAELRINEINASSSALDKKAILIVTASIACAVFFLTHSLAGDHNIKANYIIYAIQICFSLMFLCIAMESAMAVHWVDIMDLRNLSNFLNESANSSMPLMAIQEKLLLLYIDAINRMDEGLRKRSLSLVKSIRSFLYCILGAVVFLIFIKGGDFLMVIIPDMGIINDFKALLQGKDG